MEEELGVLKERNVYDIVQQPQNTKVIGCRWIFKLKQDSKGTVQKYQARLVAQGHRQVPGLDYFDTFSPVVNYACLDLFMSLLVISMGWVHKHFRCKVCLFI
ncbi:hypothetical protein AVEN_147636-1 [Araneus ventricosus]|uniref:Reverse transcriptase Ty1/copia-type domain-containing protein n=1 Tax=Araneus ventricosus TaxID=182803 RepID=A0A4Y2HEH8_ARAVE|nr:hypothetical protein AVEN_147636-1 [Araneus ventricosus]